MDDRFNDWYKISSVAIDGDTLTKRWAGIERSYGELAPAQWFELVKLFFGRLEKDDQFEQVFRQPFFELDPTFEMKKNALEIRVLAGSLLAHILASSSFTENVMRASLALVTLTAKGVSPAPPLSDVSELAEGWLLRTSDSLREAAMIKRRPAVRLDSNALVKISEAISGNIVPDALSGVHEFLTLVSKEFDKLSRRVEELERVYSLSQEEVQMVWWLFGESSNDLRRPFSKIKAPAAAVLVGKELAEQVSVFPGPRAAEAYLDRMLARVKPQKKVSFAQAVEALEPDWCRARTREHRDSEMLDLCPLFCGIASRTEFPKGDGWKPVFQSRAKVDIDKAIALVELALQTYQEFLLLRSADTKKQ